MDRGKLLGFSHLLSEHTEAAQPGRTYARIIRDRPSDGTM